MPLLIKIYKQKTVVLTGAGFDMCKRFGDPKVDSPYLNFLFRKF